MSCLLISERIMRDKIAQGIQEGEEGVGLGPPRDQPPPAPESDGNREPAPTTIPKEEEEEERITRRGYKGEERGIKIPSCRSA